MKKSKKRGSRRPWTAAQKRAFKETIRKKKEGKMVPIDRLLTQDEFDRLRTIVHTLNAMDSAQQCRALLYLRQRYSRVWPIE